MRTEEFAFAADILSIIGSLQCGGFLLDPSKRVLSLNAIAAHRLGDGLALRRNRLVATERESDARLQSLIEQALNLTGSSDAPATWLELHRAAGTPLLLRILWLQESMRPALNGASLLLVTFDPEIRQAPPVDMLARMFALTRAEAEVATAIASGRRVAEIAADRGVNVETVRTHSKVAFAKTRTRGQTELAALLTRLAFLVPPGEADVAQANALTDLRIFRPPK
jgi:DNA-binding CsgD family transcriptional regulator